MNTSFEHKNQAPTQRASQHVSQSAKAYPSHTIVRAKLEMTEPGDHDEQEADAVANTIVNGGKIARKISGGGGSSGIAVSQQMESQLSQLQGGGRQMPEGLRNMMESGFGQDFSQVRLHTDSEAASMSSSIHAKAFTLGNDIYFNRGQFSPETTEGQRLVAHELTHVVQGSRKVVGRWLWPWEDSESEEEKNRKAMAKRNMEKYIAEPDWIKTDVLGDEKLYERLLLNYLVDNVKKPISLIIYTSKNAGGGAFENSDLLESLIENSDKERVLMIQAPTDINDLTRKINSIISTYGDLKDVIFSGHGNIDVIKLNDGFGLSSHSYYSNYSIIDSVLLTILYSMSNNINNPHAIVFDSCLTDADPTSKGLSQYTRDYIDDYNKGKTQGPSVNVWGNEKKVWDGQEVKYDEKRNLQLIGGFWNKKAPHSSNAGDLRDINDCDSFREVLANMIGKLEDRASFKNPDDLSYCSFLFLSYYPDDEYESAKFACTFVFDLHDIVNFVIEKKDLPGERNHLIRFLNGIRYHDNSLLEIIKNSGNGNNLILRKINGLKYYLDSNNIEAVYQSYH